LAEYLTNSGHRPLIFCATPAAGKIPLSTAFGRVDYEENLLRGQEIDLIVVLDSGDLRRAGIEGFVKTECPPSLI